ncbi:MAG: PAS domain S-box protein [Spirochaetes bacterium]|nr:PAS domain S-box protein [Spirochaetota bacterium]
MKIFYNLKLRQFFYYFLIILFYFLIDQLILKSFIYNHEFKNEIENQEKISEILADQIDYFFETAMKEIKNFSLSPEVRSLNKDIVDKKILEFNKLTQFFDYFFVLDETGKWFSYPTREDFVGTSIPEGNMDLIEYTVNTDEIYFSDVVKPLIDELITGLAVRIHGNKNGKKMILRGVYIITQKNKIYELIKNFKFHENGYAYLVSKKGILISHSKIIPISKNIEDHNYSEYEPVKQALSGRTGYVNYLYDGRKYTATYQKLKYAEWVLVLQQPYDDILQRVNININFFRITNIVLLLLILIITTISLNYPLSAFSNLLKILKNKKIVEKKYFKPKDQVQEIIYSINHIFKELFNSRDELDKIMQKYRDLIESTSDWIWEVDKNGVYTYSSPNVYYILGYKPEEVVGKTPFDFMDDSESDKVKKQYLKYLNNKKPFYNFINTNKHKKGHKVILESNGVPFFDKNKEILGYRGIDRDITERDNYQRAIEKSLAEKEILLAEIHHRIKNNLQVISSIIQLQTYYIEDKYTLGILNDTITRIRTISFIHQKLYKTDDFVNIDLKDFFETIIISLYSTYNIDTKKIKYKININDLNLDIMKIMPCSLIINEIVTNSFKYAFPDDRDGNIIIDLSYEDDKYKLIVSDNGVGMDKDIDFGKITSLGFRLIYELAKQLNAEVKIINDNGIKVIVIF